MVYIKQYVYIIHMYSICIWANYNNSLTWNLGPIWESLAIPKHPWHGLAWIGKIGIPWMLRWTSPKQAAKPPLPSPNAIKNHGKSRVNPCKSVLSPLSLYHHVNVFWLASMVDGSITFSKYIHHVLVQSPLSITLVGFYHHPYSHNF